MNQQELEQEVWQTEQRQRALQSQLADMQSRVNIFKEFQEEYNGFKERVEKLEKDVWNLIEKVEKNGN